MFAFRLALALSLVLPAAVAADELFRAPAPPWVELLPVPDATAALQAAAQGGVVHRLADTQVAWVDEELFTFVRRVDEVADAAGVDAVGMIRIDYDPAFETVTLTHLDVIRAGQVIRLDDTPAVMSRRDGGVDAATGDSRLTASLRVPGLQVGDIVDHGILRRSLPRFPGDNRGGSLRLQGDAPVGMSRLVLNWPAGWPTYFSGWSARVGYAAAAGPDGATRHAWTLRDAIPEPVPAAAPPGWLGGLVLEWSADADWSGIAGALSDHYTRPQSLGDWDGRVEQIRQAHATEAERAIAALRMVQDDLRSVSLPVGAGGLFARSPDQTIASGYGDGKDKALLLRAMLDRLGIPATVALTHRSDGRRLNGTRPRMDAFDHAIVRFEVEGTTQWADPSLTHQGGDLWTMVPPDYAFALPLDGPNRQAPEAIPAAYTMQENRTVTQDYAFSLAGMHLSVITTLSGRSADDGRREFAATPLADIEADRLGALSVLYPGLRQIAPIEVSDDRVFNSVTITERYFLPSPDLWAEGLIGAFPFVAPDFTAGLPAAVDASRAAPVWFGPVATLSHSIIVTGAPVTFGPPEPAFVANEAWSYNLDAWAGEPGALTMNWSFNRLRSDLPASDAAQALTDAQVVTDSTFFTWNLRATD